MDGVFMCRILKTLLTCILLTILCWSASLFSDRKKLNEGLIRFHVVANSNSVEDQSVKEMVRDAVLNSMRNDLESIRDVQEAKQYLKLNLPKIEAIANQTLKSMGFENRVKATLCKEGFDTRHYDTFSLPGGVYDSLRIVIGEGEGKNWWCVSFPCLCTPTTSEDFEASAVSAGFSEPLSKSLAGKSEYQIRFFLLDTIGQLENMLFAG